MEKITTLYERDEAQRGRPVKPGLKSSCTWVEAGEGLATRKLDGTNVKVERGALWKRQKSQPRVTTTTLPTSQLVETIRLTVTSLKLSMHKKSGLTASTKRSGRRSRVPRRGMSAIRWSE